MFDQIKPIINKILDLVEEIKYEMLKNPFAKIKI